MTGDPTKVSRAGDSMCGPLKLPTDGLVAGGSQLVLANGNVGIGTTSPSVALQVSAGTSELLRLDGNSPAITFYQHRNTWLTGEIQSIDNGNWGSDIAIFTEPTSGTGPTPLVEAMRVTSAGNVGIGTTDPKSNLVVSASDSHTQILVQNTSSTSRKYPNVMVENFYGSNNASSHPVIYLNNYGGDINAPLPVKAGQAIGRYIFGGYTGSGLSQVASIDVMSTGDYTSFNNIPTVMAFSVGGPNPAFPEKKCCSPMPRMTINSNGNVGIGVYSASYTLQVVGTAGLSTGTSWTNTSDIRLKDVEGDYEYCLAEVKKLHTIRFRYKKDNPLNLPYEQEHTGFIAQEVRELIPDAVITRADGYLELNVDPIHWATVNAVKELAEENDRLKARADKAEAESAALKAALCRKFSDLPICGSNSVK